MLRDRLLGPGVALLVGLLVVACTPAPVGEGSSATGRDHAAAGRGCRHPVGRACRDHAVGRACRHPVGRACRDHAVGRGCRHPVGRACRDHAVGRACRDLAGRACRDHAGTEPTAVRLLHAWDLRRSRAYARGSVPALRGLYVDRAGVADVRLLRAYAARGYRVTGMRMQLLDVTVLAHAPQRWRLRVTDRLDGAVAVGAGRRTALPRDRASTRVVQLVRGTDGRWRVASVREVSAAPRPAGRASWGPRR